MGGSSQNKAEVKQEIPSDRASSGSRKVSERYRNPSADVELISSDGTSFMIHSYHLLSTSQVFRDLLSAPSTSSSSPSSPNSYTANEPKIIRLTDNSIEHKQQVEDLLDLIHGVSLSGIVVDNIERFRRLARLILKYDCPAPLRMLRTHVRAEMAEGHVGPIHKFFLSMLLDDPRGCRDAIRLAGGRRWGSEGSAPIDKAGPNQAVSGENTFDPGCMSISLLERFPSRYLACYLRACRLRGTMEGTGGEWGKVADEFYRLMMMD